VKQVSRNKIVFLEIARAVSAIFVLIHHLLSNAMPAYLAWSNNFLDIGRVGVVTFFLVSGYIIPYSIENLQVSQFIIRRIFKIFPVFWFALLISILVANYVSSSDYSIHELLLNAFLMQAFLGPNILSVAWTLTIELFFYAQTAFFLKARKIERMPNLYFIWLLFFLAASLVERTLKLDLPITFFC